MFSVKTRLHQFLTVCLCFTVFPIAIHAQEITPGKSSLKLAPQDSSFYFSISNIRAQVDRVWKSNAIQKVVKYLDDEGALSEEFKEEFFEGFIEGFARGADIDEDELHDWLDKPENKELLKLITDAASSEMFMFANEDYCDAMGAYVDVTRELTQMMFELIIAGELDADEGEVMMSMIKKVFPKEKLEKLKVPDLVIGFQISNEKRAIEQIKRLEALIREGLDEVDTEKKWAKRLQWQKLGDGNYLTMSASGKDIPWDLVMEEMEDEARELFEYYKDAINKKTIALAVGVYKNNLIFSSGDDLSHLKNLGSGENLLSHPKFAKVRKVGGKRSAVTFYMSQKMAENTYTWSEYLQQQLSVGAAVFVGLRPTFGGAVEPKDDDDDKFAKRVRADLKEFARDMKTLTPEPGAFVSHVFMTPTGYAGFSQSWAENKSHDGSRKLEILQNVGENPVAVFAARSPYRPEDYEIFAKWCYKVVEYVSEMGGEEIANMDAEEFEKTYGKVKEMMMKVHRSIKNHWIPALKDGQSALVIDASMKSKQFHPMMPESKRELTIPQPVIIYGVSDADLIKKGAGTFIEVANEATSLVIKTFNEDAEPFKIPPAKHEKVGDADYYYYSLKDYLGGKDDSIAATAGLSKDRLILAFNRDTAKKCMGKSSPKYDSFVNEYVDKKLSRFSYLDWKKMMDIWDGWYEYLIDQADEQGMIDESFEEALPAIELAMEVIACFQNSSSVSFVEDKSVVTMFEWKFQDIPK